MAQKTIKAKKKNPKEKSMMSSFRLSIGSRIGGFLLQSSTLAQGLVDDPLQLAIGAAELVRSPLLNGSHRLRVDAQDEILCFFLFHGN